MTGEVISIASGGSRLAAAYKGAADLAGTLVVGNYPASGFRLLIRAAAVQMTSLTTDGATPDYLLQLADELDDPTTPSEAA